MFPNVDIAILIKHPQLIDQVRQCAQKLIDAGARVALYYLGSDIPNEDQEARLLLLKRMDDLAECYTANPRLAHRYGLGCMPISRLAERLKKADRVIPF